MVRAAVLSAPGESLRLAELDLPEPGPGQVRVRIAATGVCHSDLSLAKGTLRQAMPVVLGHESAGTVVSVGEGVTSAAPGDRVVLCWAPPDGTCWYCLQGEPWLCETSSSAASAPYAKVDGQDVYPGLSTGGFAEETVVSERAVLKVPDAVPLEHAALVGCAVMTGVGAVLNTAKVRAGQSVLVVGLGGVGLSVVQGARLAGAGEVIVVDRAPEKLELAQAMGATQVLEAGGELAKQVRGLTDEARRRPRLRLRRARRHDPLLLVRDPPRRHHHDRGHRRQGAAGHLQRPRAVPLRAGHPGLRLRQHRPDDRHPEDPRLRRGGPARPRRPHHRHRRAGRRSTAPSPT